MNGHLSDEQWAAAILESSQGATAEHLSGCAACRDELTSFADAVRATREGIRSVAERPESFWRQQREGITTRLASRERYQPWKRWVWATASLMLMLWASTVLHRNAAPSFSPSAQTDPDDALMLSVQQSIRSELPQALRPAALLTQEIDRAAESRRNP